MFWSSRKPFKKDSNDRVFCIILHNFAEHKFADFAWKLSSLQFSNETMLESTQKIVKIGLHYYVINHQWYRVGYIIMCNLQTQISRSCLQRHLLTIFSLIINLKKKEEKRKKIKTFFASIYQAFQLDILQ